MMNDILVLKYETFSHLFSDNEADYPVTYTVTDYEYPYNGVYEVRCEEVTLNLPKFIGLTDSHLVALLRSNIFWMNLTDAEYVVKKIREYEDEQGVQPRL